MPPSSRLLLLVASLLLAHETIAMPYLVITPSRSQKCVGVPHVGNAKITVQYEFLEYDMRGDNIEITIQPALADDDAFDVDDDQQMDDDTNRRHSSAKSYRVPKKNGSIEYESKWGADLEICVNANKDEHQRMTKPTMVSLKVVETASLRKDADFGRQFSAEFLEEKKEETKLEKDKDQQKMDQNKAHEHMSTTEKTIYNLIREVGLVQGNADNQRKHEARFFKKTKDMHRATKIWPIIHLIVLIVTGTFNARYMVRFFKSRRVM